MPEVLNEKMVFFAEKYQLSDYDNQPLPFDLFHQSGAILAAKGSRIPKEKLKSAFIKISDLSPELVPNTGDTMGSSDQAQRVYLERILSESYQEEAPEVIEARLELLDFEPIAEVKKNLRKNIYEIKEIFQKKIINNTVQLSSKNNLILSRNIANYIETIINTPVYASDYIEMIHAIKNEENYITFSHSLSVSFYSIAIAKKLKMLREDFYGRVNIGRWLPVKTEKHPKHMPPQRFSNQMLKYFDYQLQGIKGKYKPHVVAALTERVYDRMHDYVQLNPDNNLPALVPVYDSLMNQHLVIAALNCDIGKLCIPNYLLNKPERLTEEDWKVIKQHPVKSVVKLKEMCNYPPQPLIYILGHHNLNNMIGYPILNRSLPEESKIITLADIYDAMTSARHCGKKKTHTEAMAYIRGLYDGGYIDYALYLTAAHTFEEFNHEFIEERSKNIVTPK